MSISYKTVKTPISGLKIHLNRVANDERGFFCDIAEIDNPIWKNGAKHLHASIAIKKGVARGEHYNFRLKENFYILSGTSLFIFHDFRKKSKTYGKTWSLILGFSPKPRLPGSDPGSLGGAKSYFIDKGKLAQIEISPYIYHAFWPLTNEKVLAFVTGNTGYDASDFSRPKLHDVPGAEKILKKFNLRP